MTELSFSNPEAEVWIPDGLPVDEGLARTTHLAIGAHPDDLEIMAFDGIAQCFQREDRWFTGVVVTDGRGSPRDGLYADYDDERMRIVRRKEQKKAAIVGEYAAQVLLDHPSKAVKDGSARAPIDDVLAVLRATRPRVVYTHNLADKHDTHVGVALKTIAALRELPESDRPEHVLGCEVWRDLDWMCDDDKVILRASAHENLQTALVGVFDSQICGGKRYDLATMGRRRANATYFASHGVDQALGMNFAMDLTILVTDPELDPLAHAMTHIERFRADVEARIGRMRGS